MAQGVVDGGVRTLDDDVVSDTAAINEGRCGVPQERRVNARSINSDVMDGATLSTFKHKPLLKTPLNIVIIRQRRSRRRRSRRRRSTWSSFREEELRKTSSSLISARFLPTFTRNAYLYSTALEARFSRQKNTCHIRWQKQQDNTGASGWGYGRPSIGRPNVNWREGFSCPIWRLIQGHSKSHYTTG